MPRPLTVMREGKRIRFQVDADKPFSLYDGRPPRRRNWPARLPGLKWSQRDYLRPGSGRTIGRDRREPYAKTAEFELDGWKLSSLGVCVRVQRLRPGAEQYADFCDLIRDDKGVVHGYSDDPPDWVIKWADEKLLPWHAGNVLRRYPRVVAHLICASLGYATPTVAAAIVACALNDRRHYCEWINACYHDDPVPAVQAAIQQRHSHRGYMAEYVQALALVCREIMGAGDPQAMAAWF